jgi:hypothetical protein
MCDTTYWVSGAHQIMEWSSVAWGIEGIICHLNWRAFLQDDIT